MNLIPKMKKPLPKEKFSCPQSQQLHRLAIFELCDRISSLKRKKFVKRFLPVHMGPMTNILRKKNYGRNSRDTVPESDLVFI